MWRQYQYLLYSERTLWSWFFSSDAYPINLSIKNSITSRWLLLLAIFVSLSDSLNKKKNPDESGPNDFFLLLCIAPLLHCKTFYVHASQEPCHVENISFSPLTLLSFHVYVYLTYISFFSFHSRECRERIFFLFIICSLFLDWQKYIMYIFCVFTRALCTVSIQLSQEKNVPLALLLRCDMMV